MIPQSPTLIRKYLRSYMRNENFVLTPEDADQLMVTLSAFIKDDIAQSNLQVLKEMTEIADFITTFKNEMRAMDVNNLKSKTTDELDVVLVTTEEAVGQILECAEDIDTLMMGASDELSEKLQDVSTRIYEASNFQDLNGQRIIKVIKTFRTLEGKIFKLLEEIGGRLETGENQPEKETSPSENENLLNGPQKPTEAFSQEDIDKLFSQG
ncbi:Chemotaxis regulator CheZ domain protein [Candidatus Bealeia paramacronuclearis]|uniref:Chemotaxis regulator CheZ domain protein n=1 Tax=Candidatus Bealeia paramacronuclearis TaxID=1921001 RepID=A0ABZ2C5B8_9PROT|nr:Chemotaxis regulator CheZ domain protein [Candidatus Bealeia paramacronuclearis]